jgi:hypothetical protein
MRLTPEGVQFCLDKGYLDSDPEKKQHMLSALQKGKQMSTPDLAELVKDILFEHPGIDENDVHMHLYEKGVITQAKKLDSALGILKQAGIVEV